MPRALRMPSLPRGPRRYFVETLFDYQRRAGRPTLETISERLRLRDDLPGTASKETVRKMLKGETVGNRWPNALSVFLVFCELAEIDPESQVDDDGNYDAPTHRERFRQQWNAAYDAPENPSDNADDLPF